MVQGHGASVGRTGPIRSRPPETSTGLSGRQREVLALLSEGVTAREIAVRLDLAEATVRNHIRAILRKLGCHSQLEAVAVAYRLGLIRRDADGALSEPGSIRLDAAQP